MVTKVKEEIVVKIVEKILVKEKTRNVKNNDITKNSF